MSDSPSNLKAICAVAIVLGILGVLGGVVGAVALAWPKTAVAPNADPKLAALNEEFQKRILASQADLRPFQRVLVPIGLLVSTSLIVAGFGGLKLRRLGFLQVTLIASAVVDGMGGALGMIAQFRTSGVTSWYFRETAAVSSLPPAVSAAMQFAATSGIATTVIWLVGKLGFYLWAALQLRKPALPPPVAGS